MSGEAVKGVEEKGRRRGRGRGRDDGDDDDDEWRSSLDWTPFLLEAFNDARDALDGSLKTLHEGPKARRETRLGDRACDE
jgi:hypothetical protein